ncbi:MAG: DMT family transporter, partial [Salinisphaera sp.]|nr:DMT family transporter [Salinisphaera sp.]
PRPPHASRLTPHASRLTPDKVMTAAHVVSRRTAWLLLVAVLFSLGCNWPIMKYGLAYIPPLHFAAARLLLGGLFLAAAAWAAGALKLPKRADLPLVFAVGLLQMAAFLTLITIAIQFVPAGRSAILTYTISLWVIPLAALFLDEHVAPLKGLGLALGLGGVAVLFNPLGFDWSDPSVLLGNGLLLFAAMVWAVMIVLVRGYHGVSSALTLCPWQLLVAVCTVLPLALLTEHTSSIVWGWPLLLVLAYNGTLATAFAYWAMLALTQALPATTTALALLGVPVVGMLSAALILGEPITWTMGLGLGLILGGLILVALADRATAAKARETAPQSLSNATRVKG